MTPTTSSFKKGLHAETARRHAWLLILVAAATVAGVLLAPRAAGAGAVGVTVGVAAGDALVPRARAMSDGSSAPVAAAADASEAPCFYFYHGARRALELDPNRLAVRLSPRGAARGAAGIERATGLSIERATPTGLGSWMLLDLPAARGPDQPVAEAGGPALPPETARVRAAIAAALAAPSVEFAAPVFRAEDGGWSTVTSDLLLQLVPRFRDAAGALLEELSGQAVVADAHYGNLPGAYRLQVAARDGFQVLALANRLAQDPRVAWAEPNMQFTGRHLDLSANQAFPLPDDPGFTGLWGIHNTGQFGGTPGIDMGGLEAWDVTTGSADVKALVLDVGVQQDHPDLNTEPGADFTWELGAGGGPVNGCDNHGTAVAGCISAIINNGLGTIGIAPSCPVLSARIAVSNPDCSGWVGEINATVYALAWGFVRGARVSNNSNGYGFSSNAIDQAYASTRDGGMVHFASAGNGGPQIVPYPASIPTVNAIAALRSDGQLASFSNFGPGIPFCAPGEAVFTTDRTGAAGWVGGDYVYASGTSFSSPYAAGVAALLFSQDTTRSAADVEDLLRGGCLDLGDPGHDNVFGWGLVNAFNSLLLGQEMLQARLAVGDGPPGAALRLAGANPFIDRAELSFTLPAAGPVALEVFDARGRRVRVLARGSFTAGSHSIVWDGRGDRGQASPAGIYFLRLRALDKTEVKKLVRLGGGGS